MKYFLLFLAASYIAGCDVAVEAETDTDSDLIALDDYQTVVGEYTEKIDECEQDVDALLAENESCELESSSWKAEARRVGTMLELRTEQYDGIKQHYSYMKNLLLSLPIGTLTDEQLDTIYAFDLSVER